MIERSINIDELVSRYPVSVQFLSEKGIRCIRCGEPVWGTLETAAKEKGFTDKQINEVLDNLNRLIAQQGSDS